METLYWISITALLVSMSMAFAVTFLIIGYDVRNPQNFYLASFTILIGVWAVSSVVMRLELGLGDGDTLLSFSAMAITRTAANAFLLLFASRYVNKKKRIYDIISVALLFLIVVASIFRSEGGLLTLPTLVDGYIVTYEISFLGQIVGTLLMIPLFLSLWLFLSLGEKKEYREPQLAFGVLFLILGYYLGELLNLPLLLSILANTTGVLVIGGTLIQKQIYNPLKLQNDRLKREIAEKKKVKRALTTSERRFQALIENSFDGILVLDGEGHLEYSSPANHRVLGYGRDNQEGEMIFQIVDPGSLPSMMADYKTALSNPGTMVTGVYKIRHKNGHWRWIEGQMNNLLDDPHVNGLVLNFRDVTERHESAEKLKDSEKRNRMVIELSPFPISISDTQGNFVDINPSMAHFAGYTKKDLMGKNLSDIVAQDSISSLFGALEETSRGRPISPRTMRFKTKPDSYRIMDMSLAPILEAGIVRSIISIGRDVTEQKEAEEQLQKAFHRLKEIDGMRSDFIDMAAHEIRTPLSSIKAYIDLMTEGNIGKFSEEESTYLKEMNENIKILDKLVSEMLDYTRTGAKKLEISTEKKDLTEIARGSATGLRKMMDIHNVSLTINSEGETFAQVDEDMLGKVFSNLLSNALKYSPEGGRIMVTLVEHDDDIEVSVEDTGMGIMKDDLPYIFERFYMGSVTLTREKDRMGLGLPISRSIVDRHGGRIWVKSKQGKGSTFYFVIPKTPPENIEELVDAG